MSLSYLFNECNTLAHIYYLFYHVMLSLCCFFYDIACGKSWFSFYAAAWLLFSFYYYRRNLFTGMKKGAQIGSERL